MKKRAMVFIDSGFLHKELSDVIFENLETIRTKQIQGSDEFYYNLLKRHIAAFCRSGFPYAPKFYQGPDDGETNNPTHDNQLLKSVGHAIGGKGGSRRDKRTIHKLAQEAYKNRYLPIVWDWFNYNEFCECITRCSKKEIENGNTIPLDTDVDLSRVIVYGGELPSTGANAYERWVNEHYFNLIDLLPKFAKRLASIINQKNAPRKEKGVDITLAADMIRLASRNMYDLAVLVTGDNDFYPAVSAIVDLGPCVKVVTWERKDADVPKMLLREADIRICMEKSDLTRWIRKPDDPKPTLNENLLIRSI